jgi:hypothetical protein
LTSSDGVPYAPFDRAGTYSFTVSNVGFDMAQVSGGEINPGNDACLAFSYLR